MTPTGSLDNLSILLMLGNTGDWKMMNRDADLLLDTLSVHLSYSRQISVAAPFCLIGLIQHPLSMARIGSNENDVYV